MGDTEDAQVNALRSVPGFDKAMVLMCFFHVLYNVRKRTQHLSPSDRSIVMNSITDMHFCPSEFDFYDCRDRELSRWRSIPHLRAFADYFEAQWLRGHFWRWQVYHSPEGYATTNNPCEVFNAAIKTFVQRKRFHMQLLLQKMCEFLEGLTVSGPALPTCVPVANSELKKAARALIATGRVQVYDVAGTSCVRVKMIDLPIRVVNSVTGDDEDGDDQAALEELYDDMLHPPTEAQESLHELDQPSLDPNTTNNDVDALVLRDRLADEEEAEAKRQSEKELAAKSLALYERIIKWSLRRSHRVGMPENGWFVNPVTRTCGCRYYFKFKICAHIEIAGMKRNMRIDEIDGNPKLKNRALGKKKRTAQRQSKTNGRKSHAKKSKSSCMSMPNASHAHEQLANAHGAIQTTYAPPPSRTLPDYPFVPPHQPEQPRSATFKLSGYGPELLSTSSVDEAMSMATTTLVPAAKTAQDNGSHFSPMRGRPPRSTRALDVQFVIDA